MIDTAASALLADLSLHPEAVFAGVPAGIVDGRKGTRHL
jgi:hypothetical protein